MEDTLDSKSDYEEERNRRVAIESLLAVTHALSTTLEINSALDVVVEESIGVFNADAAAVWLWDDAQSNLTIHASRGLSKNLVESQRLFPERIETVLGEGGKTATPFVVDDIRKAPLGDLIQAEKEGLRASLIAPLVNDQNDLIGILTVASKDKKRTFSDTEVGLAAAFASQAATAIERGQLFRAVQRHANTSLALLTVSRAVASQLDLQSCLSTVAAEANRLVRADSCTIYMPEDGEETRLLKPMVSLGMQAEHFLSEAMAVEGSVVGSVYTSGQGKLVNDAVNQLHLNSATTKSLLAVPLPGPGRPRAVMMLTSFQDGYRLGTQELEVLTSFSIQAAIAVQNAQLYEELGEQLDEAQTLNQRLRALQSVGASVAGSLSAHEVLQTVREATRLVLKHPAEPHFVLLDGSEQLFLYPISKDSWLIEQLETVLGAEVPKIRLPLAEQSSALQETLKSGKPRLVRNITDLTPGFIDAESAGEMQKLVDERGIHAFLIIPLVIKSRVLGAMLLPLQTPTVSDDELYMLVSFAEQAATALDNARLFEETTRRVSELTVLRQVAVAAASASTLEELLKSVADVVASLLYHEQFSLSLVDHEKNSFRIVAAYEASDGWNNYEAAIGTGVIGHVAKTGESMIVNDTSKEPLFIVTGFNTRSEMAIPLKIRGEVVGVMNVESTELAAFSTEDAHFLELLGQQLSGTIERVRLHDSLNEHAVQLESALDDLKEADQLKSRIVQNVSHELRTPLTYITSYVDLLRMDEHLLNEQQSSMLEIVASKADSLGQLIDDFVTLQTMEARPLNIKPTPVSQIVDEALDGCRALADQSGIELRKKVSDGLPLLNIDPLRVQQVFDNLLSNAIKFSPEGGQISIAANKNKDMITIAVSDTGVGISPADREQIFERFYQVDGSITRRFGGVGLGLAICQQIVQAHGGKIWVESSGVRGEGSTFSFTLPRAD